MGQIDEAQMVRQWYPNGEQPATAAPLFIPICGDSPGIQAAPQGGTFDAPLLVQCYCATQGASIAYTLKQEERTQWQLYTEPLCLPEGTTTLRAKAIRIGYQESTESVATFTVKRGEE
jgi:hypothetical protein